MNEAGEIFKRIRPKCVALVEMTFTDSFKSGSPALLDALKALNKELSISVTDLYMKQNGTLALPVNLAEYVMVPLSKILKLNELSDSELEYVLSIIHILLKYSWCQSGVLSKDLFTQYVTLISFLIGGKPNEFDIGMRSEETYLAGIRCLKELLSGSLNQGSNFTSAIVQDTKFIPTLGFLVSILLNITVQSIAVELRCQSLEALNILFHLINDGEILSLFFPGAISSMAKIVRMKPHSNVIMDLFITMSTLTNLIFSDFDLGVQIEDVIDSLETLKTTVEEQEDGEEGIDFASLVNIKVPENMHVGKKHRTSTWLSSTMVQFQKAISIILNIDLNRYDKRSLRDAIFQFDVKVIRNCFVSCNALVPSLIRSLSSICGIDSTFISATVDSLCYTTNSDALKNVLHKLLVEELHQMQHDFLSTDTSKAERNIQLLTLIVSVLNGMGGVDRQTVSKVLNKVQENIALVIELKSTTERKKKKVTTSVSDSIQNRLVLVSSHYSRDSFQDVKQEYLFAGVFPASFESHTRDLLKAISYSVDGVQDFTGNVEISTVYSSTKIAVREAVLSWLQSTIISQMQDENTFNTDDFLQFDDDDDNNTDSEGIERGGNSEMNKELFLNNTSYLLIERSTSLLRQCVDITTNPYTVVLTTVMSLRTINNCAMVLKETFADELIDLLYPIVECLSSENEIIRTEAQFVTSTIAGLLYDGSIEQMLSENSDYLIDALSFKLVGGALTPKVPIILSVIVRLGFLDIVSELDDIIKTVFTLLDMYYGYDSLVEGFFLVFNEIITKVYDELYQYDFEKLALELEEDNVQYFGIWGLTSDNDVEDFVKKKAFLIDELSGDSDDEPENENGISEETLKRSKYLEIDSDESDAESMVNSAPSIKSNASRRTDEDENTWASPISTKLYETISNILSYAERLMQSNTKQLTIFLLKTIDRIIPLLATQKSRFLPVAANIWELIRNTLDTNSDLRILGVCIDIFESLIKYGNTFFTARFLDMYKSVTCHKILRPIMNNQIRLVTKMEKSSSTKVLNPTSTSTNWESELFHRTAKFILFALNKYGRYIPSDVAMSMISVTVYYDSDPSSYGYFDDLVVFLQQYKSKSNDPLRISFT